MSPAIARSGSARGGRRAHHRQCSSDLAGPWSRPSALAPTPGSLPHPATIDASNQDGWLAEQSRSQVGRWRAPPASILHARLARRALNRQPPTAHRTAAHIAHSHWVGSDGVPAWDRSSWRLQLEHAVDDGAESRMRCLRLSYHVKMPPSPAAQSETAGRQIVSR